MFPPCCPSGYPDGMHVIVSVKTKNQKVSSEISPRSSNAICCASPPFFRSSHCSLVIKIERGLLPWKGPTIPFSSNFFFMLLSLLKFGKIIPKVLENLSKYILTFLYSYPTIIYACLHQIVRVRLRCNTY